MQIKNTSEVFIVNTIHFRINPTIIRLIFLVIITVNIVINLWKRKNMTTYTAVYLIVCMEHIMFIFSNFMFQHICIIGAELQLNYHHKLSLLKTSPHYVQTLMDTLSHEAGKALQILYISFGIHTTNYEYMWFDESPHYLARFIICLINVIEKFYFITSSTMYRFTWIANVPCY